MVDPPVAGREAARRAVLTSHAAVWVNVRVALLVVVMEAAKEAAKAAAQVGSSFVLQI